MERSVAERAASWARAYKPTDQFAAAGWLASYVLGRYLTAPPSDMEWRDAGPTPLAMPSHPGQGLRMLIDVQKLTGLYAERTFQLTGLVGLYAERTGEVPDPAATPLVHLALSMSRYAVDGQAWFDLGRAFARWYEAHGQTCWRSSREVDAAAPMPPDADRRAITDARLGRYTPPPLAGLAEATRAIGPAVPPELFTVRHVLGPIADADAGGRWDVLKQQGQVPALSPPHVWAPTAVLRLDAAIARDLGWLALGALPCPVWDRDLGELRFNRVLLKSVVTGKAVNVVAVLDAFQAGWWPPRIDLPAEDRRIASTRVKTEWLHQTLKSLNTNLEGVRFRSDGRGDGIVWEFAG